VSVAVRFVAEPARSSFTGLRVPPRGFLPARSLPRRFQQRPDIGAAMPASLGDKFGFQTDSRTSPSHWSPPISSFLARERKTLACNSKNWMKASTNVALLGILMARSWKYRRRQAIILRSRRRLLIFRARFELCVRAIRTSISSPSRRWRVTPAFRGTRVHSHGSGCG
jgi:hypothetical protein